MQPSPDPGTYPSPLASGALDPSRSARSAQFPRQGIDLLLVQDDRRRVAQCGRAARATAVAVRNARTGESGLAAALSRAPDVMVVDLDLPDLTGFEVTRRLREDPRTAGVAVLLTSCHADPESRAAAWTCGADGFLARPFLPAQLLSCATLLAARGRRLRANDGLAANSVRFLLAHLEVHAPAARERGERCAQAVTAFGQHAGLDDDELLDLERAALLHDVGSILLPDGARRAAGAGNRPHALLAARVLDALPELTSVARIVRHHHERWDGQGYPDGLSQGDIPRAARLLAVVDAFLLLRDAGVGGRRTPLVPVLRELSRWARDGALQPDLVARLADGVALGIIPG